MVVAVDTVVRLAAVALVTDTALKVVTVVSAVAAVVLAPHITLLTTLKADTVVSVTYLSNGND